MKKKPLSRGASLKCGSISYTINNVIAFGDTCIAYTAQRKQSAYEQRIGLPTFPSIIKEFYPIELSSSITRKKSGLFIPAAKQQRFNELRRQFERGAIYQQSFSLSDSNHSLPPIRMARANNTVYSIVDYVRGVILENIRETPSLLDITDIIISLCNAVQRLHKDGKVHLDIKPSNIFLFEKDEEELPRVALFDFNTVTAIDSIKFAEIPFSPGWSPREQKQGVIQKISYSADIYAIGAVLFWLISGEKVTDDMLDRIKRNKFDFLDDFPVLNNRRNARGDICELLSITLKRDPMERAQCIEDLM